MQNKLTEGPLLPALVALSVPIVLANLLQTAYSLVNAFWVGRLGAAAVAAVSISFPIYFLLISLGGGLAIAGTILVAQHTGAKRRDLVDHVTSQSMILIGLVSLVLTAVGIVAAEPILRFMGAGADVLPLAVPYLQITFSSLLFVYIFIAFQSLLRGVGDSRTPLIVVFLSVLLNSILDPILINGMFGAPALGVPGAAIGTVVSQFLAAAVGLYLLFSGKRGLKFRFEPLNRKTIGEIVRLGAPASIEQSMISLGFILILSVVATFGTEALAAFGIGGRIMSLAFIPAIGLSLAVTTAVGQNLGAHKPERASEAVKLSNLYGFVFLTLLGVLLFIFAEPLSAFFIPSDTKVIQLATEFLRIFSWSLGLFGLFQVYVGALRGAKKTLEAMVLSIVILWVLRFPLAVFFSKNLGLGVDGIWWAFPLSNVIGVALAWWVYKRRKWKTELTPAQERVVEEAEVEEAVPR